MIPLIQHIKNLLRAGRNWSSGPTLLGRPVMHMNIPHAKTLAAEHGEERNNQEENPEDKANAERKCIAKIDKSASLYGPVDDFQTSGAMRVTASSSEVNKGASPTPKHRFAQGRAPTPQNCKIPGLHKEEIKVPFNIDLFDSYYLAGVIKEMVPAMTFFRDRYFPTDPKTDVFMADKVLVEYMDTADHRLAPFVVPRTGDILVSRKGYEAHEIEPPFIAPSRFLTLDDLKRRGFGEALYANSSATDRAAALQFQDLMDLDRRIARREEWMAAQTMINNGFTAISYIDDKITSEVFDIYFYDITKTNPSLYTVTEKWDDPLGDFWSDVEIICEALYERGITATDLVVGSRVGQFLTADEKLAKLLDNRRMEFGLVKPEIKSPGVTWLGNINLNGFNLDIFISHETYMDDEGTSQYYFPPKGAMVTYAGCGHMMYAKITQIEPDEEYHIFAAKRVAKFIADPDKDIRKLRLASRPLAAPIIKTPWMYAPDVLK